VAARLWILMQGSMRLAIFPALEGRISTKGRVCCNAPGQNAGVSGTGVAAETMRRGVFRAMRDDRCA